jgi:hypothetical protein
MSKRVLLRTGARRLIGEHTDRTGHLATARHSSTA